MRTTLTLCHLLAVLCVTGTLLAAPGKGAPTIDPLVRVVDLNVGQQGAVKLCDGKTVIVKLLNLKEKRDPLRNGLRDAKVTVEVNGRQVVLTAAFYRLPITVGDVQIDCAATKGLVQKDRRGNPWALDADARLRLWPAGSPWIRPGTYTYPVNMRWFASDTQMANVPVFVDGGEIPANKSVYYHSGLDVGGAEYQVEIVSASDGVVIVVGEEALEEDRPRPEFRKGNDGVAIRDARGWYHRYAHLCSVDPAIQPGREVKQGQKIGILGKEGTSGGWSHLHYAISAMQPSGRLGVVEAYAFFWQEYHAAHGTRLQAVARPHHFTWTGEPVVLDASLSWSIRGPKHIAKYEWTFGDGTTAGGPTARRVYNEPGTHREILKVTDQDGNVDYDFAVVQIIDRDNPTEGPPAIHAVYYPTFDIKAGDEITFKVRTFRIGAEEGHETWDFGDGTPIVTVSSDGNAQKLAKDGYAVTTHRYTKPGHYLVRVQRTNDRGETATGRLHVRVGPR